MKTCSSRLNQWPKYGEVYLGSFQKVGSILIDLIDLSGVLRVRSQCWWYQTNHNEDFMWDIMGDIMGIFPWHLFFRDMRKIPSQPFQWKTWGFIMRSLEPSLGIAIRGFNNSWSSITKLRWRKVAFWCWQKCLGTCSGYHQIFRFVLARVSETSPEKRRCLHGLGDIYTNYDYDCKRNNGFPHGSWVLTWFHRCWVGHWGHRATPSSHPNFRWGFSQKPSSELFMVAPWLWKAPNPHDLPIPLSPMRCPMGGTPTPWGDHVGFVLGLRQSGAWEHHRRPQASPGAVTPPKNRRGLVGWLAKPLGFGETNGGFP